MTRDDKIKKKKLNATKRAVKNGERNRYRFKRTGGFGVDCPFDVDMYNRYRTCTCGGTKYDECAGDI